VDLPCFIPVCFYETSLFSRKDTTRRILEKYVNPSRPAFVLVCDTIYAYNLMIWDRCPSYNEALAKAHRRGFSASRMLCNLRKILNYDDCLSIKRWDDVTNTDTYLNVHERVLDLYQKGGKFTAEVDRFVDASLVRFMKRRTEARSRWEVKYVLGEVAMSIVVTELYGYPLELWEFVPNSCAPDPIGLVYVECREELLQWTGKSQLDRRLQEIDVS